MGRLNPPSLSTLFLRQNPNHPFRNIRINGGEEILLDQDQSFSTQPKVAKEVSRIIRTNPGWEQTLVSDFPFANFLDSCFLNEVLKNQRDAHLSVQLLHWVKSQFGVSPESSSCGLVFNALVKAKAVKDAMDFLKLTNFVPEPACLELYFRCLFENGMIEEALEVLDRLKKTSTLLSLETWNMALLGSIKAGRADIVWKLYGEMIEVGVGLDNNTVGYLIRAFCMENNVSKGYELLRQVLEAGYLPNNVAFTHLISGFLKDRNFSRVSAILHIMIAKNCNPDIYTYQVIIHGLCVGRMRHEAFRIFNDLKDRGYAPNRVMYTTMINGLCKMKMIGMAQNLWFEMIEKGIMPNEYTYTALISGLFSNGNVEEAHKFYKEMCDKCGANIVSSNVMIKGLCMHGMMNEATNMFQQMQQKGITPDALTYNSLIRGFYKQEKISESLNLLYELLFKGLQPSADSYTYIIEKLCEMGQVDEAKALWEDMQDRGVEPASCTNDFIIHGLIKEGDEEQGIKWLCRMLKDGLIPREVNLQNLKGLYVRMSEKGLAKIIHGCQYIERIILLSCNGPRKIKVANLQNLKGLYIRTIDGNQRVAVSANSLEFMIYHTDKPSQFFLNIKARNLEILELDGPRITDERLQNLITAKFPVLPMKYGGIASNRQSLKKMKSGGHFTDGKNQQMHCKILEIITSSNCLQYLALH